MPELTQENRPLIYREIDEKLDEPVHSKYNVVENFIDNYRAKNRETKDYLNYNRDMNAEKYYDPVGRDKLSDEDRATLKDSEYVQNDTVENGFLIMDNSNPMMRYAEEIYEGFNQPPTFAANIYTADENNIANINQHTYATMNATVYNKTEKRMVRYRFGVGLHATGLAHDPGGGAPMVASKDCTYQDLHIAFTYITKFQYKRNTSWRLFSTNCNNFVRELAEVIGMHDIASLMRSVSCVQTFRNMSKAADEKAKTGKYKDIQFFSEENLSENNKAMSDYDPTDANLRYSPTTEMMRFANDELILPSIIKDMGESLLQVNAGACGYNSVKDFKAAYETFKDHPFYPKFWGKKKKFKKTEFMDQLFRRSVIPRVDEARKLYEKWCLYNLEMINQEGAQQGETVDEIQLKIRKRRGVYFREAYSMINDAFDYVLAQMPADKLSQPYRHFVLRCKGFLRGAESASFAAEQNHIVTDAKEHMDTIYVDDLKAMSDYKELQESLYNEEQVKYYDGNLSTYSLTLAQNPSGLHNLGYLFLRSLGSIHGHFEMVFEKVSCNKKTIEKAYIEKRPVDPKQILKADINDVSSVINQLAMAIGELRHADELPKDKVNEAPKVFLRNLIAANGPMVKNPEIIAWTLIHGVLECLHTLWKQVCNRMEKSYNEGKLPQGKKMTDAFLSIETEHLTFASMGQSQMDKENLMALNTPHMGETQEFHDVAMGLIINNINAMQNQLTEIIAEIIPPDQRNDNFGPFENRQNQAPENPQEAEG